jgi:hypothetical protein
MRLVVHPAAEGQRLVPHPPGNADELPRGRVPHARYPSGIHLRRPIVGAAPSPPMSFVNEKFPVERPDPAAAQAPHAIAVRPWPPRAPPWSKARPRIGDRNGDHWPPGMMARATRCEGRLDERQPGFLCALSFTTPHLDFSKYRRFCLVNFI